MLTLFTLVSHIASILLLLANLRCECIQFDVSLTTVASTSGDFTLKCYLGTNVGVSGDGVDVQLMVRSTYSLIHSLHWTKYI